MITQMPQILERLLSSKPGALDAPESVSGDFEEAVVADRLREAKEELASEAGQATAFIAGMVQVPDLTVTKDLVVLRDGPVVVSSEAMMLAGVQPLRTDAAASAQQDPAKVEPAAAGQGIGVLEPVSFAADLGSATNTTKEGVKTQVAAVMGQMVATADHAGVVPNVAAPVDSVPRGAEIMVTVLPVAAVRPNSMETAWRARLLDVEEANDAALPEKIPVDASPTLQQVPQQFDGDGLSKPTMSVCDEVATVKVDTTPNIEATKVYRAESVVEAPLPDTAALEPSASTIAVTGLTNFAAAMTAVAPGRVSLGHEPRVAAMPMVSIPLPANMPMQLLRHADSARKEPVEVLLAPEDLGRLKFQIHQQGDVTRVVLSVERPETLDLLRRHCAEVMQEFHDAGFAGATLSFGQWAQQDRPATPTAVSKMVDETQQDSFVLRPVTRPAPVVGGSGLNIRL